VYLFILISSLQQFVFRAAADDFSPQAVMNKRYGEAISCAASLVVLI